MMPRKYEKRSKQASLNGGNPADQDVETAAKDNQVLPILWILFLNNAHSNCRWKMISLVIELL